VTAFANTFASAVSGELRALERDLKGGLPIIIGGETVGGIGIGSGTGEQDREIAAAALAAFPGAATFSFS
jgi:uncharacterized protein GlcG (DUF336 family)